MTPRRSLDNQGTQTASRPWTKLLPSLNRRLRSAWIPLLTTVLGHPAVRLVLVLLIIATQLVLVAITMYLVDLTISLCELWVDLARRHLEITL